MKRITCFLIVGLLGLGSVLQACEPKSRQENQEADLTESAAEDFQLTPEPIPEPAEAALVPEVTVKPAAKIVLDPEEVEEARNQQLSKKTLPSSYVIENVPHMMQRPEFATGCEPVAAAMVLNYYGIDIDVAAFVDDYLPVFYLDSDVAPGLDDGFLGDPRAEDGAGCHPACIVKCYEHIFRDLGLEEEFTARDVTGTSLEDLCKRYITEGVPVLLWSTIYMADHFERKTWTNERTGEEEWFFLWDHCLVLIGYDEDNYYFSDSLSVSEVTGYPKSSVEYAYKMTGKYAAVILPK